MTTKLDEFKQIFYLNRLASKLIEECKQRLELMTPAGLEEYATETIRKVSELELVQAELKQRWTDWQEKYPNG